MTPDRSFDVIVYDVIASYENAYANNSQKRDRAVGKVSRGATTM